MTSYQGTAYSTTVERLCCAGLGKTEVMVRQVVHLRTPDLENSLLPGNIMAFTFNEKAAGEVFGPYDPVDQGGAAPGEGTGMRKESRLACSKRGGFLARQARRFARPYGSGTALRPPLSLRRVAEDGGAK